MAEIRPAQLADLEVVASWLASASDCRLWAGHRVSYPMDVATLPGAIEWDRSESWSGTAGGAVVAFGQLVPKPGRRVHLARLIAAPEHRGEGLGRLLARHLLHAAIRSSPSSVSLNVVVETEPALDLYRSLGFVPATRPAD